MAVTYEKIGDLLSTIGRRGLSTDIRIKDEQKEYLRRNPSAYAHLPANTQQEIREFLNEGKRSRYEYVEDIIDIAQEYGKIPDYVKIRQKQKDFIRKNPHVLEELPEDLQNEIKVKLEPSLGEEFIRGKPEKVERVPQFTRPQQELLDMATQFTKEKGLPALMDLAQQRMPQYETPQTRFATNISQLLQPMGGVQGALSALSGPLLQGIAGIASPSGQAPFPDAVGGGSDLASLLGGIAPLLGQSFIQQGGPQHISQGISSLLGQLPSLQQVQGAAQPLFEKATSLFGNLLRRQ